MRKGIKILAKVLSALLLLAIFLPLCLALLLMLDPVQNYVAEKAAAFASRKLETTVRIGRVDIGFFDRVRLTDLYVEDYQRDTLLFAGRIEASVGSLGLLGGGIVLREAELSDALLDLKETPEGVMNIKQLIDRINRKKSDGGGKFLLTFRHLKADSLEFRLRRRDERKRSYGVDWADMRLRGITAELKDFTIDGPTIAGEIARFAGRERSGFVLDDLSGRLYLVNGGIGLTEARIRTPRSDVRIPSILLVGDSWADYKYFVRDVAIDGELSNSVLSTDDVAYFAPALKDWHLTLRELGFAVTGPVDVLQASGLQFVTGEATRLHADVRTKGLPDFRHTRFDVRLHRLRTTAGDAASLSGALMRKELPEKVAELLSRAGTVDVTGSFEGRFDRFQTRAVVAAGVGTADCKLTMNPAGNRLSELAGRISARNFRLGELLGQRKLGRVTLDASLDGLVGGSGTDARIRGEVSLLEFNGVAYDSLQVDGRLLNREFDGHVQARDAKLDFDFDGLVDLNGRTPHYDFALDLRRADLHAMRINLRDSVSLLRARIEACVSGRSLDDVDGEVRLTNASYRYNATAIDSVSLLLTGHNTPRSKRIDLRSEFADLSFRSRRGYKEAFGYLRNSLYTYLPLLYDRAEPFAEATAVTEADDYSSLTVSVGHIDPITDAIASGLQIADGSQVHLLFNPASHQLSLRVRSEYVERRNMLATNLSVTAVNQGDSLVMHASAEDLYSGGLHLRQVSLTGGAARNRFILSGGFNDTATRFSAQLGVRGAVARPEGAGRRIDLRFTPSRITQGDKTWQIFARGIRIDSARVAIDRFAVRNGDQQLLVDGVASRSRTDSVRLTLRNFELAPFAQFAAEMGYSIGGVTNGYAVAQSALRESVVTADIRFDSLRANDMEAPPLRLLSRWDFEKNRAGVLLLDRARRDTLVEGFYIPSRGRYYARARIDSLPLGLLDPLLKGVIGRTKGRADLDLTISGQRRDATMKGTVAVAGLSTKVDFTQVTYTVPSAVIDVENSRIELRRTKVFDPEGNAGEMNFMLDLSHLSNIVYRLDIAPRQMLVLNTTRQDNDLFYGHVYATGAARIAGDKRGVSMDIAAATDDHTAFYMPLSGKSSVAKSDFVIFESADKPDTTDYLVRKKLLFERNRKRKAAGGGRMDINLALDVRPNAEFQLIVDPSAGDMLRGRGEGTLNLHINPRAGVFEMYGDYQITEGSYQFSLQNIISKRFIIEGGSTIQWTGEPMDAMLNIDAVYKLKTSLQPLLGSTDGVTNSRAVPVDCIIHLGERLSNPSKSFSILLPNADSETQTAVANILNTETTIARQFIALLIAGSFLPENSMEASTNLGAVASAATGFELLSNQLSRMLSNDDYSVLFRYKPGNETNGDELDFGFSTGLIDNRLLIEVEGNYVLDNRQAINSQMSNFMGEAYVTWLIDRAGTLRLKGFTHTIDRFDETQGLQETGIGIYFKEDFNTLKDLRQRIRDRFTDRKRQARRAERRAAKARERAAAGDDPHEADALRETDDALQEGADER